MATPFRFARLVGARANPARSPSGTARLSLRPRHAISPLFARSYSSFSMPRSDFMHRSLRTVRALTIYVLKVFALVHLVNTLVFEVRSCAGASMLPTLSLEGDFLLQIRLPLLRSWDKLKASLKGDSSLRSSASGPRKKPNSSAPGDLLSVLNTGDLVVALSPFDPTRVVCKRLIGLPGDTVLVEPRLGLRPIGGSGSGSGSGGGRKKRWRPSEELEEDDLARIHEAWRSTDIKAERGTDDIDSRQVDASKRTDADDKAPLLLHRPSYVTVPPGHVWLCGDNMGNSSDSRDYGPVPMGLLRGKVVARLFPAPRWFRDPMTEA